jgi:hypothetical protein
MYHAAIRPEVLTAVFGCAGHDRSGQGYCASLGRYPRGWFGLRVDGQLTRDRGAPAPRELLEALFYSHITMS